MTTVGQGPQREQPAASPSASSSARRRPLGPAGLAAGRCISRLQRQYRQDNPAAVADLAKLRRGAGKTAHQVQDHWGLGGLEELAEVLAGSEAYVRREHAEEAVYLAVTLWALHQQSVRDSDMHSPKSSLGGAVRTLMRGKQNESRSADELNEPLRKRLVRVGTAESIESVAVRLREIVLLLRGEQVPLDYGRLADQLYRWQSRPDRAAVRREWGREFHLAASSGKPRQGNSGDEGDAIDLTLSADEEENSYGSGE
ncbi:MULTISPECIES: type I-E CRISPR-associated protein Cse2/CasB [unclassified Streptomyces]|uniref:type I-E CRISPR-associated protein Cse2/CasB n=1 Tax=unclassified Streptomyces TaxID=2593676 RepID=UPI002E2ADA73|nr:type I-E CRISPR-associated protein Cse2/CasB [Streptomyces sp. NBC_01429]